MTKLFDDDDGRATTVERRTSGRVRKKPTRYGVVGPVVDRPIAGPIDLLTPVVVVRAERAASTEKPDVATQTTTTQTTTTTTTVVATQTTTTTTDVATQTDDVSIRDRCEYERDANVIERLVTVERDLREALVRATERCAASAKSECDRARKERDNAKKVSPVTT